MVVLNFNKDWNSVTRGYTWCCRKKGAVGNGLSTASVHGIVLGLAACVLSMPYDMPRYVLLCPFNACSVVLPSSQSSFLTLCCGF